MHVPDTLTHLVSHPIPRPTRLRLVHSACTRCIYLPRISPPPSAHSSPVSIVYTMCTPLPTSYPTPSLGPFVSGRYTMHVPDTLTHLVSHPIPWPTRLRLVHCMYQMYLPASYLT